LPPFQGDTQSDAQKINADGIICGHSWRLVENPDGSQTNVGAPVVWQAYLDGGATPVVTNPVALPAPAGMTGSAHAINDLDAEGICQIVGRGSNSQGHVPLRWTVASTEFGLIAAPTPEQLDEAGVAYGVNNRGDVCGHSPTGYLASATVWSGENTFVLKRARNIGHTFGRDINDAGIVVGEGGYEKRGVFYSFRAAVWASPQSDMILVDSFLSNNSPYVELNSGSAVNPSGDIVGHGWTGDKQNAYLAIRR
jgi:hypothetical protein